MMYDIHGTPLTISAVCHRGWTQDGAEGNTLDAYKQAKAHGYKCIECDAQYTSDDVIVLSHDGTINGMTISQTTYATLKASVPSILRFDDFMAWCNANEMHPYVDIKFGSKYYPTVAKIAKDTGMLANTTWLGTFMKSYAPNGRYGTLKEWYSDSENYANYDSQNFISINADQWTIAQAKRLGDMGIPFECYTVNNIQKAQSFMDVGAVGFTTDSILPSALPTMAYDISGVPVR